METEKKYLGFGKSALFVCIYELYSHLKYSFKFLQRKTPKFYSAVPFFFITHMKCLSNCPYSKKIPLPQKTSGYWPDVGAFFFLKFYYILRNMENSIGPAVSIFSCFRQFPKFCIKKNNNKVDSIEIGRIVIAYLLLWRDLEKCTYGVTYRYYLIYKQFTCSVF